MAKINTENLIADLVKEKLDKKIYFPEKYFVKWLFLTLIYFFVISSIFGIRSDLLTKLKDFRYLIELLSIILITITSLFSCCYLALPDNSQKKYILYLPIIAFTIFVINIIFISLTDQNLIPINHSNGLKCVVCITASSVVPATFLFYEIKKAAPTKLYLIGFYVIFYATSLCAFALRLENSESSIYQTIIYHYLPIVVYSFLGGLISKKILKW
jgi:hypothetical protein